MKKFIHFKAFIVVFTLSLLSYSTMFSRCPKYATQYTTSFPVHLLPTNNTCWANITFCKYMDDIFNTHIEILSVEFPEMGCLVGADLTSPDMWEEINRAILGYCGNYLGWYYPCPPGVTSIPIVVHKTACWGMEFYAGETCRLLSCEGEGECSVTYSVCWDYNTSGSFLNISVISTSSSRGSCEQQEPHLIWREFYRPEIIETIPCNAICN